MKVKDMMHKGVGCVSPDTAIDPVAKKMRELDVGAIPVASDGKLVGMVTDRDITICCVADNETMSKIKAKDVMTSGVVYCRETSRTPSASWKESRSDGCRCSTSRCGSWAGSVSGTSRTRSRATSPARWRRPSQRTTPRGAVGQAAACSNSGFHWPSEASPFMRAR
jgi:CBS domain